MLTLALATVVTFFGFGYLFGLSGHPAGPNVPAGCYTVYLVAAPILALLAALALVRRLARRL